MTAAHGRHDEQARRTIQRLQDDSPALWQAFVARLTSAAQESAARVMSGSPDRPAFGREDLAGEVLLNVLRNPIVTQQLYEAARRDPSGEELRRYLTVVARNRLRDQGRKSSRHKEASLDGPSEPPPDPTDEQGAQESSFLLSLSLAMAMLSGQERRVIELKYWQDKALHAIAKEMGLSVTSTFRLLHRAMEHVRESLADAP
jgi:RNA polymerase sigma factor (sigma-70 family)